MNDKTFVDNFERLELDGLPHRDHLRLAWIYLDLYAFGDALQRLRVGLAKFAASKSAAEKYSETITIAYLSLMAERQNNRPTKSFAEFERENPDLFDGLMPLYRYYSLDILHSDSARVAFVMPDRVRSASHA